MFACTMHVQRRANPSSANKLPFTVNRRIFVERGENNPPCARLPLAQDPVPLIHSCLPLSSIRDANLRLLPLIRMRGKLTRFSKAVPLDTSFKHL